MGLRYQPGLPQGGDHRLVEQQPESAGKDNEVEQMQQDLLPVYIQRDSHKITPLQYEDDEYCNYQGVNDRGLDEYQTKHHVGTYLVCSLGLA